MQLFGLGDVLHAVSCLLKSLLMVTLLPRYHPLSSGKKNPSEYANNILQLVSDVLPEQ